MTFDDVIAEFGCSRSTVYAALANAGLEALGQTRRVRSIRPRPRGRARNPHNDVLNRPASMPPVLHPAVAEGRTLYPGQVMQPGQRAILKGGRNSPKIGPKILKGHWTGFPVFTLTLEERATCPDCCRHWRSCMGNNMHWSERYVGGP